MTEPTNVRDIMARAERALGLDREVTPEERERREKRVAQAETDKRRAERDAAAYRLHRLRLPITAADEDALLDGALLETPALGAVRAWQAANAHPWLVLCGPVGRGKTLAASAALFAAGGAYVGARELERLSMAKFGDESAAFANLQNTSGVLVIDDVGREDDIGRMQSALLDLVDYRRSRGKRTILATNFSRKAFCERYSDARLQSRLAECATWFADVGEDMRRAK